MCRHLHEINPSSFLNWRAHSQINVASNLNEFPAHKEKYTKTRRHTLSGECGVICDKPSVNLTETKLKPLLTFFACKIACLLENKRKIHLQMKDISF